MAVCPPCSPVHLTLGSGPPLRTGEGEGGAVRPSQGGRGGRRGTLQASCADSLLPLPTGQAPWGSREVLTAPALSRMSS